jgi:membrane-associated protease RseP (regulator of RpoE activity)
MRWLGALLGTFLIFGCTTGEETTEAQYTQPTQYQAQAYQQQQPPTYQQQPMGQAPETQYQSAPAPGAQYPQEVPPGQYQQPAAGPKHLGVGVEQMSRQLRTYFGAPRDQGVLVTHVAPSSLAAQAGIQAGDVIVSAGGQIIRSGEELRDALQAANGPTLVLQVIRRGQPLQVDVALGGPQMENGYNQATM